MILSGLAVTGGFYGAALAESYIWPDWHGAAAMRVPVLGPIVALTRIPCSYNQSSGDATVTVQEPNCGTGDEVVRAILASVTLLGQLGGLALIAEGLMMPTSETVEVGSTEVTVVAAPVVGPDQVGVGVSGSF